MTRDIELPPLGRNWLPATLSDLTACQRSAVRQLERSGTVSGLWRNTDSSNAVVNVRQHDADGPITSRYSIPPYYGETRFIASQRSA